MRHSIGMNKITIIGGSSCDLRDGDITSTAVNFTTVPLTIRLNGADWVDTMDLDTRKLVAEMKVNRDKPLTACPSPEEFADKMREAKGDVIVVTIGAKLSGTYNSAVTAMKTVQAEMPDKKIHVIDSMSASAGETLIIHNIIDMNEGGLVNFDELVKRAEEMRSTIRNRFLLQDLSNLVKTGRMSKVKGIIASVLNIRLICGDDTNGEIKQYAKVIGTNKAITTLAEFPKEKLENLDTPIIITHVHNEAGVNSLKSLLEKIGFSNIRTYLMRGLASFYANDQGLILAY